MSLLQVKMKIGNCKASILRTTRKTESIFIEKIKHYFFYIYIDKLNRIVSNFFTLSLTERYATIGRNPTGRHLICD